MQFVFLHHIFCKLLQGSQLLLNKMFRYILLYFHNKLVEKDLQMLRDLGLDPDWENDFADQLGGGGCGNKCGSEGKPVEAAVTA